VSFLADSSLVDVVRSSPNHGERVGGPPDALVLHYTGMPRSADAIDRLCDASAQVSAHYVIEESGRIWQLVPESRRAWHAGRSRWSGESDLNSRSIGIEICNPGHDGGLPAFPRRQIERVVALVADILARTGITPVRVLAHSDIAPDRKDDPGERFPWGSLARAGLCLHAHPAPISEKPVAPQESEALRLALRDLGYAISDGADWTEADLLALRAFQRRHRRARIDGAPDRSSLVTARRLLRLSQLPRA
jgi:N-acetylmuramoyl-L-alanine amidase